MPPCPKTFIHLEIVAVEGHKFALMASVEAEVLQRIKYIYIYSPDLMIVDVIYRIRVCYMFARIGKWLEREYSLIGKLIYQARNVEENYECIFFQGFFVICS